MSASRERLPTEAMIAVNLQCNARCSMCGIWKLEPQAALEPHDYVNLPRSLQRVGVTGGEPFMRRDIAAVLRTIHEAAGAPQIIVSTNGYLTGKILAALEALDDLRPRIGLGVSLDGMNGTHDRIRGTKNAFDKVMRTLHALKAARISNVRISFTITNENVDEMPAVYELSRTLGIEFCSQVAQNSRLYYHTSSNTRVDPLRLRAAIGRINARELGSFSPKPWFRAYFNSGIVEHNESGRRLAACSALDDFFYLSPQGDVYPCLFVPTAVGNITERAFEQIWIDDRRREALNAISGCDSCWLMCTARTSLMRNATSAAAWVLKAQARRAVGAAL